MIVFHTCDLQCGQVWKLQLEIFIVLGILRYEVWITMKFLWVEFWTSMKYCCLNLLFSHMDIFTNYIGRATWFFSSISESYFSFQVCMLRVKLLCLGFFNWSFTKGETLFCSVLSSSLTVNSGFWKKPNQTQTKPTTKFCTEYLLFYLTSLLCIPMYVCMLYRDFYQPIFFLFLRQRLRSLVYIAWTKV